MGFTPGDPRSGWQGPTTAQPGGADPAPQTQDPIPWGFLRNALLGGPCCPLPSLPQAPLGSEGWPGEPPSRQEPGSQEAMLRALDAGLERCLALHSAVQCIPVPRHR